MTSTSFCHEPVMALLPMLLGLAAVAATHSSGTAEKLCAFALPPPRFARIEGRACAGPGCPQRMRSRPTSQSAQMHLLPYPVYEDDDLLIVNKPAGIGFHDDEEKTAGIISVLRRMQAEGQLGYTGRLHGVHRLDKVTSGCLILGKNSRAASEASAALREKRVAKYYVALSDKKPSKKQGTIKGDMQRTRRSSWRLTDTQVSPAITRFVHRAFSTGVAFPWDVTTKKAGISAQSAGGKGGWEGGAEGEGECHILRMFVMRPLSGKTHQLRVLNYVDYFFILNWVHNYVDCFCFLH